MNDYGDAKHCPSCGYDTRASATSVCPECGWNVLDAPSAELIGAPLAIALNRHRNWVRRLGLIAWAGFKPKWLINFKSPQTDLKVAPGVGPAAVYAAALFLVITVLTLLVGAGLGRMLGTWGADPRGSLLFWAWNIAGAVYYGFHFAFAALAIAAAVSARAHELTRNTLRLAALFFVLSLPGECVRRGAFFLASMVAAVWFPDTDPELLFRLAGIPGYATFALVILVSLGAARTWLTNVAVAGTCTAVLLLEPALWAPWAIHIAGPVIHAFGL